MKRKEKAVSKYIICVQINTCHDFSLYFCDYDKDLIFEGQTYYSVPEPFISDIGKNNSSNKSESYIYLNLNHIKILEKDILNGLYNGSEVLVFLIDITYLAINISYPLLNLRSCDHDKIQILKIQKGKISSITIDFNGEFYAEIDGITSYFDYPITKSYSRTCRASFCDKLCKLNHSIYSDNGLEIKQLDLPNKITIERPKDFCAPETFSNFEMRLNAIQNGYVKINIKNNVDVQNIRHYKYPILSIFTGDNNIIITTMQTISEQISIGDSADIMYGCNKTFYMCSKVFNNNINFRGEPNIEHLAL